MTASPSFFLFFEPTHRCRTELLGAGGGGGVMCGKGITKRGTAGNSQPAATRTEGRR